MLEWKLKLKSRKGGFVSALLLLMLMLMLMLKCYCVFRAIMAAVVLGALWILLPQEKPVDRQGKIDWIGAVLGTSGLIVFNVAWK